MARIVNEVREAVLAKLEPVRKSKRKTTKVEKVVGRIRRINRK